MKKEIEQSIFVDDEDEGFVIEVILYKDGTSKRILYSEDGKPISLPF